MIRKGIVLLLRDDLESMGIDARVLKSDFDKVRVVFKNRTDMHLYKVSGKYQDADYINYAYDHIEFRYGLWQHIISYFINKDWGRWLIFISWVISFACAFVKYFYNP